MMALQPNALLTVEQGRGYLRAELPDTTLEEMINRVSDYCQGPAGAGRQFVSMDFQNLRLRGQRDRRLRPPITPIDVESAITVSLDGIALTVWRSEADGDPSLKDVIVGGDEPGVASYLWQDSGWLGTTSFPVLLSYTGGYAQSGLPGDLLEAAYLILDQVYRNQVPKTSGDEIAALGPGPVTPAITFRESLVPLKAQRLLDARRVAV